MNNADEVQRALTYQAVHARGKLADDRRKRQLAGDPAAKLEFDERWMPLQAWLDENRKG